MGNVNSRTIFDTKFEVRAFELNGQLREVALRTDHFAMGRAAFDAAAQCFTYARVTFQNGARIIDEIETGAYDSETRQVALLKGPSISQEARIRNKLYEALELIDAPVDLLQIVGSWGDTMPASETLEQLRAFVARQREEAR